jgi:ADP-ribose pyrophosphatase YjhB (NUDIX family)
VLVIPYALHAFPEVAYALCRADDDADGCWHVPAGDGRRSELPPEAARRHAAQLAGVPQDAPLRALDSRAIILLDARAADCGLTEYAFGVRVDPVDVQVPAGQEQLWVSYEVADGFLRRQAERNALWELHRRLGFPRRCR